MDGISLIPIAVYFCSKLLCRLSGDGVTDILVAVHPTKSVASAIKAKHFTLFEEVFSKYIALTANLTLTTSNGNGKWWNRSVPKRIDNAIDGFWKMFNEDNLEMVICHHMDILTSWLKA